MHLKSQGTFQNVKLKYTNFFTNLNVAFLFPCRTPQQTVNYMLVHRIFSTFNVSAAPFMISYLNRLHNLTVPFNVNDLFQKALT